MQCLLGCTGVSPAQHNYSLFLGVVLGSAMFRLRSDVFCYIYSVLALLYYLFVCFFPLFCPFVAHLHFIIFERAADDIAV